MQGRGKLLLSTTVYWDVCPRRRCTCSPVTMITLSVMSTLVTGRGAWAYFRMLEMTMPSTRTAMAAFLDENPILGPCFDPASCVITTIRGQRPLTFKTNKVSLTLTTSLPQVRRDSDLPSPPLAKLHSYSLSTFKITKSILRTSLVRRMASQQRTKHSFSGTETCALFFTMTRYSHCTRSDRHSHFRSSIIRHSPPVGQMTSRNHWGI